MKNDKFRTPLIQSAAVLAGVIVLALIAASSGSGGGFFSVLAGIGYAILFFIGLTISLAICIAILVGVFLGAVGMVSPEQARQMYSDIKKKFALSLIAWSASNTSGPGNLISEDEYNRMKQEIIDLRATNRSLAEKIKDLEESKDLQ